MCLNGAAARLVQEGDVIIAISYAMIEEEKVSYHQPKVAIMDENNRITEILGYEPASTIL